MFGIQGINNWPIILKSTAVAFAGGAAAYIFSYLVTKCLFGRGYLPMGMEDTEAQFRDQRAKMNPLLGSLPAALAPNAKRGFMELEPSKRGDR